LAKEQYGGKSYSFPSPKGQSSFGVPLEKGYVDIRLEYSNILPLITPKSITKPSSALALAFWQVQIHIIQLPFLEYCI